MDHSRFDAMAQALGNRSTRRPMLRALGGLAFGVAALPAATAEAKKKCKKPRVKCGSVCCPKGEKCIDGTCMVPCKFASTGQTRRLLADCTIDRTIQLAAGETLDGDGHTVTMTGAISKFFGAGLVATRGTTEVRNLTLQAQNLRGACEVGALPISGIALSGPAATLTDVTVRQIGNGTCGGFGVYLTSTGSGQMALTRVTISELEQGITIFREGSGTGAVTLDDISLSAMTTGARLRSVTGTFTNSSWSGIDDVALYVEARARMTVSNSEMQGVRYGVVVEENANADITGNTIVGSPPAVYGIGFRENTTGSATGNTISNFQNPGVTTGCGIATFEGPDVIIEANTFPPPDNDQDICEFP